ncbi:hypothetical protein [Streptomyces sp. SID3343]|uniref:hypothetical protein n=1 Tax=Streptomyces sp. SID3343 TaxID=2690260 RepID=UPI00192939C1|nr:hypothetical protein [Streptomyces sp. SID3343]
MTRSGITAENAPTPAAPLSQGIRKGPILQVFGQPPSDPDSGRVLSRCRDDQGRGK